MQRGWFADRPDRVRRTWAWRGVAVAAVGAGLTALAAWQTHLGLVPIPIVLAGLLLCWAARKLPRQTPTGTELARRAVGFRTYLATADSDTAHGTVAEELFFRYLPYAIVFGRTRQWARAVAQPGAAPQLPWYEGQEVLPAGWLAASIDQFARVAAGTLASRPVAAGWRSFGNTFSSGDGHSWSGGGGGTFSGGGGGDSGGGGGGGGSW